MMRGGLPVEWPMDGGFSLRLVTAGDAEAVWRILERDRAELAQWQTWPDVIRGLDDTRTWLAKGEAAHRNGSGMQFGAWRGTELAAMVTTKKFEQTDRKGELSFWRGSPFRGQGIMFHALRAVLRLWFGRDGLEFNRCTVRVPTEHAVARRLVERLGFVLEGVIRKTIWLRDRFIDDALFGLLRDEYERAERAERLGGEVLRAPEPIHVFIADPLPTVALELLARANVCVTPNRAEAVGAVVRTTTRVDARWLDTLPNLKAVATASAGVDHLDLEELSRRSILAFHAPGSNADAAADFTVGQLLTLWRHSLQAHQTLSHGSWNRGELVGVELLNKTVGIIGIGNVGRRVARRLLACGMRVLACDPYVTLADLGDLAPCVTLVGLEDLLQAADVVTIHTPLTPMTRGLLNADRLALIRPSGILLNMARGGVLDENALAAALRSGRLAGAALDVFTHEPLGESPLRGAPNVLLSPHIAGLTQESQRRMAEMAVTRLVRFLIANDRQDSLSVIGVPHAIPSRNAT